MKPLISYYGGKQRIASKIVPYIKRIPHTVYVEPFVGGAAVLFAKGRPPITNGSHYREVINDIDNRLITMYRVAREQPEEFQRWIEFTLHSQEEHRESVNVLKNNSEYDDLKVAWAYYVNTQQSFAHVIFGGWRTSVRSENSAGLWQTKTNRLPGILERLSDVHIASEDAIKCIQRWDSPQTIFYCDPPYPNTDMGHYDGYTIEDWAELCNTLDNIQGSYVLSGYAQNIEPKSVQQRVEISTVCSASGKGKIKTDRSRKSTAEELGNRQRTEVLWICDRSENMRDDLKAVIEKYKDWYS